MAVPEASKQFLYLVVRSSETLKQNVGKLDLEYNKLADVMAAGESSKFNQEWLGFMHGVKVRLMSGHGHSRGYIIGFLKDRGCVPLSVTEGTCP